MTTPSTKLFNYLKVKILHKTYWPIVLFISEKSALVLALKNKSRLKFIWGQYKKEKYLDFSLMSVSKSRSPGFALEKARGAIFLIQQRNKSQMTGMIFKFKGKPEQEWLEETPRHHHQRYTSKWGSVKNIWIILYKY